MKSSILKSVCFITLICYNDVLYCKISQEVDFDTLIDKTKSIHVILLNKDEWESSICSCVWWHKNNKCNHTIALACRTKLASFDEIAFTIPLNKIICSYYSSTIFGFIYYIRENITIYTLTNYIYFN